jgi:hypothetical protein
MRQVNVSVRTVRQSEYSLFGSHCQLQVENFFLEAGRTPARCFEFEFYHAQGYVLCGCASGVSNLQPYVALDGLSTSNDVCVDEAARLLLIKPDLKDRSSPPFY